ncbi:DUF4397 domain-containing protein [Mucilaginibacter sp. BJC16-A38]|uniref:DUF4397 domain-containing protein n=1 Tax=Mucilaginibacter phenanthrenivorans TaxID=1234842 RepID=UPI002157F049|nr:DUF4397 domain-containing protein [Mucilaginibacter phenanthrenivorans]MCR8558246.1 DUF4397 domain-containing protein [Mucilaginibacter phenanthrenivorans]
MNTRYLILLFVAAAIGLSSCKNNDNVFPKQVSAFYKIINGSSDTLNYYLNGTRQNNGSSLFPGGATTYYLAVPAGSDNFQFKKNGALDVLFSVPEKLGDSVTYSLYIYGPSVDQTFKTTDVFNPDTSTVVDKITQARFVNVSPDIGDLDVYVGDTLKYQTGTFKSSNFITFGKGVKDVKVYLAGTKTLAKDTTFTMTDHTIYTIYSHGLKNGKGATKFNVAFTLNYQN